MFKGDVITSLKNCAKDFTQGYKNKNAREDVINAIVVDYINYFVGEQLGLDLALYTSDLHKKKEGHHSVDKEQIFPMLQERKDAYAKTGILESVNRNEHMNNCNGKAKCDEQEAVNIINAFIKAYMKA